MEELEKDIKFLLIKVKSNFLSDSGKIILNPNKLLYITRYIYIKLLRNGKTYSKYTVIILLKETLERVINNLSYVADNKEYIDFFIENMLETYIDTINYTIQDTKNNITLNINNLFN